MAKEKVAKKKVAKKKSAIKKSASTKIKAPEPKYALEKDVLNLFEAVTELSRSRIERDKNFKENSEFKSQEFNKLCELVKELTGHTATVRKDIAIIEDSLFEEISYIKKKLWKNRLIRKVTTESPNGTVTTEETFSSEK